MASTNVRHRVEAATDRSATGSNHRVLISFRITHHALNVFLVIRGESGHAQMCSQMEPVGNDRWTLKLSLRPGCYRYRYYAIHERVTTYVAPSNVEDKPARMNGLDAILIVPEKRVSEKRVSHPGTVEGKKHEVSHDRTRH